MISKKPKTALAKLLDNLKQTEVVQPTADGAQEIHHMPFVTASRDIVIQHDEPIVQAEKNTTHEVAMRMHTMTWR